jgi:hypothetical protein
MSAATQYLDQIAQEADKKAAAVYSDWITGIPSHSPPLVEAVYAGIWPLFVGPAGTERVRFVETDLDEPEKMAVKIPVQARFAQASLNWNQKTEGGTKVPKDNTVYIVGGLVLLGAFLLLRPRR